MTDESTSSPPKRRRRVMPAGRALLVILVALLVWAGLYAPELKRSADAADVGTRRTVSLAILARLGGATDPTGRTPAANAAARAAGRAPNGEIGGDSGVDALPPAEPNQQQQHHHKVVKDTDIRGPTPDKQLRVAVVGDSLAQGGGFAADSVFKPFWAEVFKQGRISTGLARLDYFNWMAQMHTIVDRADPDLTLVMIGENDNQGMLYPDGTLEQDVGTFDWAAHYEGRVEQFAKIATSAGGHVVWIGLPNTADKSRWDFVQRQDAIFQAVADELPNVAYFDSWNTFAAPDGGYSAFYRDGTKVSEIRSPDGVHFNTDGYALVTEKAAELATKDFNLDPKTYAP